MFHIVESLIHISHTGAEAFTNARYGMGRDMPIFIDESDCTGDEERLFDCPILGVGIHNCFHSEDAGVRCQRECKWFED